MTKDTAGQEHEDNPVLPGNEETVPLGSDKTDTTPFHPEFGMLPPEREMKAEEIKDIFGLKENERYPDLTLLGSGKTEYPRSPGEAKLETIENRWPRSVYEVELHCPEFTSLCPKTGQPDFAEIVIKYKPRKFLIESKALKLYLFSFRNIGMFHEFVVNKIMNDLADALDPEWIEVIGYFKPRGGITITPRAYRYLPVEDRYRCPGGDTLLRPDPKSSSDESLERK